MISTVLPLDRPSRSITVPVVESVITAASTSVPAVTAIRFATPTDTGVICMTPLTVSTVRPPITAAGAPVRAPDPAAQRPHGVVRERAIPGDAFELAPLDRRDEGDPRARRRAAKHHRSRDERKVERPDSMSTGRRQDPKGSDHAEADPEQQPARGSRKGRTVHLRIDRRADGDAQ